MVIGEGNGTPLQYSCLENPIDRGAWWAAVHGVAKSRTRLSDLTFTFHFHALEKEMATHSSVLAWRIPGTVEPDGLPSMGSHRVRHDWSDLAAAAAVFHRVCGTTFSYIHSSVNGHLGCFHVLTIVNSVAVNTEVHIFFWIMVLFHPRVELQDHMVILYLFEELLDGFLLGLHHFTFPPAMYTGPNFSTSLLILAI